MRVWIVRLRRSCSWLVVLRGKEKGLGLWVAWGTAAGQDSVYTIGDSHTARHWVEVDIHT